MQFTPKEARKKIIKLEPGRNADFYPHNLQFYAVPPTDNISLQEFEDLAIERLKGLLTFYLDVDLFYRLF